MNAPIRMSMSEITRVAPWSLRGLGYPFAVAERATPLIAWTEAVHGQALRMLRVNETQITVSTSLPAPRRARDADGNWVIEADGKSLIEAGPPALDLATADARANGTSQVTIIGATGAWLLPALADWSVRRELGVLIAYAAGQDDVLPASFPSTGWIAGFPTAAGPVFLEGANALDMLRHTPLAALADHHMTGDAIRAGRRGQIVLSQVAGLAGCAWNAAAHTGLPVVDYRQRVEQAYRRGIDVDAADFHNLYAVEQRSWAPTSERSRSQAGF